MSRNPAVDYTQYILEHRGRYIIGVKQKSGRYLIPLSNHEVKIYGLLYFLITPSALDTMPSYPTRSQALRRARYLFSGGREILTERDSYKPKEVRA